MWESSAKVLRIWKLKLKVMIGRKIGSHPARARHACRALTPAVALIAEPATTAMVALLRLCSMRQRC